MKYSRLDENWSFEVHSIDGFPIYADVSSIKLVSAQLESSIRPRMESFKQYNQKQSSFGSELRRDDNR